MADDSNIEFDKMLEVTAECSLRDLVSSWLNGDITPEALATFFIQLRDFKDINRLYDVFDRVVHFAFLESSEASQAKQDWTDKLVAQLRSQSKTFCAE